MHLQTASPAGWPQAGLSLWGAVPLWARGLQKAGLHPPLGVTASPAPSHRRLGLYLPPLPQLLGDFGAPLQLLLLLPPSMSLTEGVFCLFFFFFPFCLLRPFFSKDAAGQTGREGVCLPIWLRGPRRGSRRRAETSCNTVLPGWWPEDACNSRGQVPPSTLASAPASALLPHSQPALPLRGVGCPFLKLTPRASEACLGWAPPPCPHVFDCHAVLKPNKDIWSVLMHLPCEQLPLPLLSAPVGTSPAPSSGEMHPTPSLTLPHQEWAVQPKPCI